METRGQAHQSQLDELVGLLVNDAVAERATDVHLNATPSGLRVRYRIDGTLRPVREFPATLQEALPAAVQRLARLEGAPEGRMRVGDMDVRVGMIASVHGPNVVMRLLEANAVPRRLDDLGMDADTLARWRRLLHRPHGLLIITGPTGSGKTTTAYASLADIADPSRNLMTIEDPVEAILDWAVQVPASGDFACALRGIHTQDPDVVYCGEIRDGATADLVCKLALSGHLVLTCLHADDAPESLRRLAAAGVSPGIVSVAVTAILSQRREGGKAWFHLEENPTQAT